MAPPNDEITTLEDYGNTASSSAQSMHWELPQAQGLYDPQNEHEACGVGFIVAIDGQRSHKVIKLFYFNCSLLSQNVYMVL